MCSLIIRLSFCCPHSLNLDFSMHWFVFAWHLYVVFVVPSSNCTEWCIRCSVKPPLFLCLFGKGCQIKETSGLSALTCITSLPVLVLVVSCLCALFCRQNDFCFFLFLTNPSTDIQMRVDFLLLPTGCRLCLVLLKLFIYPHLEW